MRQRSLTLVILSAIVYVLVHSTTVMSQERGPAITFDPAWVPEPVLDAQPGVIEIYNAAWQSAWRHVHTDPGTAQSPFMDEAFTDGTVWIWDTEFMTMFCKYAPDRFPGVKSFLNFWKPMHDRVASSQKIWHPDNPPFFAWIEWENYRFTGDKNRLRWLIDTSAYLQKHFTFFESIRRDQSIFNCGIPVSLQRSADTVGYLWSGVSSGMDNTPRGRNSGENIYWVDAMAQQALAAQHIARIAGEVGNADLQTHYTAIYNRYKQRLNQYYWDATDGFYYDIGATGRALDKVQTPASYWAMLAGAPDSAQAAKMIRFITDPLTFGGTVMIPSLARNDSDFDPQGGYWNGAVWLPLVYMTVKALEKYGYLALADSAARSVVNHQVTTYKTYSSKSIWECYSPTQARPDPEARADFCGWSALGPISLVIENYLGFHVVDAVAKRVEWRKYQTGRHGIKRLKFGTTVTDIVGDGNTVSVSSNAAYTLVINGKEYAITAGQQTLNLGQSTAGESVTRRFPLGAARGIRVQTLSDHSEIRVYGHSSDYTVDVVSGNGAIIHSFDGHGAVDLRIGREDLAAGIYTLVVRSGAVTSVCRLLMP